MNSELIFDGLKSDPKPWDPIYFALPRKPSAVAVLLFGMDTPSPQLLLIRRSTRLRSHRGQIGFPGGRLEDGDAGPEETAMREAAEEIGISRHSIKVLGSVEPIPAIDGSLVYPIIAQTAASPEDLRANPTEVESLHFVPVQLLMSNNRKKFGFNLFGCWRHSFLYDCGTLSVWGLSAEILARVNFKWGS